MELINQHTKAIMEECKRRARLAGLKFFDETLEYIVTNRDLLELSPKVMIPTLYDYWVHDLEVLKEKGKYELYPHNPYETVINTRPAISFYNDNNPDWLNVMIFYHVLGHIDFFQGNLYYGHTWDYDFAAQALTDKRLIARLRSEKGRWVDYIIEFSRGIDNLVGYYHTLSQLDKPGSGQPKSKKRLDYFFDIYLQTIKKVPIHEYINAVDKYNRMMKEYGERGEDAFFDEIKQKNPEFESLFNKNLEEEKQGKIDIIQYILEHSVFLNKEENKWMKTVVEVVRNTSLFFQPQIRTKIMNEGWASYWHDRLFMADERIQGHEVEYARVNSGVTTMPRVGLNPYALGMKLFEYIEEMADKGKLSHRFQRIADERARQDYNEKTGKGKAFIFHIRQNYSDFLFINTFLDQEFINRHRLFVVGKRLNRERMVWEYYVKSRKVEDYRQMLLDSLYHPPHIQVNPEKSTNEYLYLEHRFEGKPLYKDYIPNTMMGIEYLWGKPVKLETSELVEPEKTPGSVFGQVYTPPKEEGAPKKEPQFHRVLYTIENRKINKTSLKN
ncbi:MAG TPA: SpoVR family protein [Candidatus Kapabacteria bacterium]|nr:SpoVR family protein [Candidatus Kapabacteria bacterium]